MDTRSLAILEDTLDELAIKRTPSAEKSRLDECVTVIRACLNLLARAPANLDYTNKIRKAIFELARIARQNGEFTISKRLKLLVRRLETPDDALHAQVARTG